MDCTAFRKPDGTYDLNALARAAYIEACNEDTDWDVVERTAPAAPNGKSGTRWSKTIREPNTKRAAARERERLMFEAERKRHEAQKKARRNTFALCAAGVTAALADAAIWVWGAALGSAQTAMLAAVWVLVVALCAAAGIEAKKAMPKTSADEVAGASVPMTKARRPAGGLPR